MTDFKDSFKQMIHEMERLVTITNKRSVLILLQHTREEDTTPRVPSVRESITNIIGFVALGDEQYLPYIIAESEGIVDTVMIDTDNKRSNSRQLCLAAQQLAESKGMSVAYYSDYATWTSSAIAFMMEIEKTNCEKNLFECTRLLTGRNPLATQMLLELINKGIDVCLLKEEYPNPQFPIAHGTITIESEHIHLVDSTSYSNLDVLIGCEIQHTTPWLDQLSAIRFKYIYDIGTQNFSQSFIENQRGNGAHIYRSDDRAGISGTVVNLMETTQLISSRLGRTTVGGIPVVSGGYLGHPGDIVVDNYLDAHTILGIANGDGTFKKNLTTEDTINLQRINKII
ncbi:MAG: hypothetical protein IJ785_09005 [Bacteroidales bacterium]|nr:hypothetical protein [Bacteroidales bacterium]